MEASDFLPVWIVLGAIPGALSRYYLTLICTQRLDGNFPYGTFLINLTGAFLMGFSATVLQKMSAEQWLSGFTTIGFLGAYTTFSTYALDFSNLLKLGNYKQALLYGLGSPTGGFLAVEMGIALAQHL
ncbi:crcB protein [Pleurocapsa sp. PCC 7327]|uniref:fluoride efflux transporter CrcB n=1 Tax=Pleurocapsa sp. PCC 7327 TaxID=118163 RepID=UPI00029FA058|nr:fluoride efflux transporter CrcB [Pleurocapsa sp. PCC 7327]AFY78003.1 crcB protein [Pleurocapsa sp. PCC 7327]